jgi:hypothetical protein
MDNFKNGLASFGVPVVGELPATAGRYFFVDYTYGMDTNNGRSMTAAVKTVAQAYSLTRTNKDDVIVLMGSAAHVMTSMLDISKNRIHFIGMDASGGRLYGQNARITMGDSTVAADIALMKNTGVRNTFTNIKFDSSSTVAASLYTVAEGGEFTLYKNCHFYKSSDLDETAAAEVLNNGDSVTWLGCTFGSTVNIIADNKIRPNMLLTREVITGKVCRDNYIEGCLFLVKAAGTEAVRIYGAGATDVERHLIVKDSIFLSNALGAATPAHAVGFGGAQTEGSVILKNCTSVDHTVMAQAAVGIYVDGAVPAFATAGVAVAS